MQCDQFLLYSLLSGVMTLDRVKFVNWDGNKLNFTSVHFFSSSSFGQCKKSHNSPDLNSQDQGSHAVISINI